MNWDSFFVGFIAGIFFINFIRMSVFMWRNFDMLYKEGMSWSKDVLKKWGLLPKQ